MLSHALLTLTMAAVALAQSDHTRGLPAVAVPAGRPNFNTNRPVPAPNPDPKDTNNNRLVGKRFELNELPLKVDTLETERGIQVGVNQCNASTQNQQSVCQTIHVNSIDDFCIFIPQTETPIGNAEAGMVAACTKPTHGARLIPAGALTGIKFYKAKTYIGIAGKINQVLLNVPAGDGGGEVDSGGQDGRGNPIGGMAYSNNLPGSEGKVTQSVVWNQFIGGDAFCMKLCSDSPDAANMCEHVYDTIGCAQNFPAEYTDGVFESCASDDHIPVGYLAAAGRSDIPATSNCTPVQSASIYAGLPQPSGGASSTTPGVSGSATSTVKPTGTNKPTGTGSGSNPSGTNTPGDAAPARISMAGVAAFLPVIAGVVGAYLV
jgi:hypothetical protein